MADVTKEQFEEIAAIVGDSTVTPERQATYGEKCKLYGLYKRATLGKLLEPFDDDDIETESRPQRPGMLQVQQRAKYDAWKACQDMTKQEAMDAYATLAMDTVGKKVKDVLAKN